MKTYCLACRKITNEVIRNKNIIKKVVSNIININVDILFKVYKKYKE